jgi:hypothetical protein
MKALDWWLASIAVACLAGAAVCILAIFCGLKLPV